jgi:hypothetical protein
VIAVPAEQLNFAELVREIELYLSAVDLFRRLGCEPCWRSDTIRHRTRSARH